MATNGTTELPMAPYKQLEEECLRKVEEISQLIPTIKDRNEYLKRYQDEATRRGHASITDHPDVIAAKMQLKGLWQTLRTKTEELFQHFKNVLAWLHEQRPGLWSGVIAWTREKRLSLLGGPEDNLNKNLTQLKESFEISESLAMALIKQIDRYVMIIEKFNAVYAHDQNHVQKCSHVKQENLNLRSMAFAFIKDLVQKGMIVYEEPRSIVRLAGQRDVSWRVGSMIPFSMEIRFLAGKISGLIQENMEIETLIISEQQARDIVTTVLNPLDQALVPVGSIAFASTGIVQAPCSQNDECMNAKILNARVRNVKKIVQQDEAAKAVYHVLFRIKLPAKRRIDGSSIDTNNSFWTLSLPFSVVSNANHQEKYRRALMFWRLSFFINDETSEALPYDEKTAVPWQQVFQALNLRFKRPTNNCSGSEKQETEKPKNQEPTVLQRGLDEHEAYFREMIGLEGTGKDDGVSFHMFYKSKTKSGKSFWEWFYSAMDYVAKYPAYWDSGFMLGFASRTVVEKMLNKAKEPSMILKFSDSHPGKPVASYIYRPSPGRVILEHVIFDKNGQDGELFANKTLAECVRLSTKLQCVAKILPCDKPIKEFYALDGDLAKTKSSGRKINGYVSPGLVFTWGDQQALPPLEPVGEDGAIEDEEEDGMATCGTDDEIEGIAEWTSGASARQSTDSPQNVSQSMGEPSSMSRQSSDSSQGPLSASSQCSGNTWPSCQYAFLQQETLQDGFQMEQEYLQDLTPQQHRFENHSVSQGPQYLSNGAQLPQQTEQQRFYHHPQHQVDEVSNGVQFNALDLNGEFNQSGYTAYTGSTWL